MNPAPLRAEVLEILTERRADLVQLSNRQPVVLSQRRWTLRTVEVENNFLASAHHMYMRRTVVVRVDDHSQSADSRYSWHSTINLSGLGFLTATLSWRIAGSMGNAA